MIIKKVALGNDKEAFIEESFTDKMNIIYSYSNNKGKTILIQSIIYALGGDALFPQSFNYKDYYFMVTIECEGKEFTICRKKDSFIVKSGTGFNIFDSYAEYRYYFDKMIFHLPRIIKDGRSHIVDINLLCELFFIPQANRNTSNVICYGYYKKQDFENVLYSLAGLDANEDFDAEEIQEKIRNLKIEQSDLRREYQLLTSFNKALNITSSESQRLQFEEKIKKVEDLKNEISSLMKQRNKLTNNKIHDEMLLQELTSLDKKFSDSELVCLKCGSKNIGYATANRECIFDISDKDTKKSILSSIQEQIDISNSEIEKISFKISENQHRMQELLKDEDVNLENLLLYKNETVNFTQADRRLDYINDELLKYTNLLKISNATDAETKQKKKALINLIEKEMQEFYTELEPNGNATFDNIYTTQTAPYSGSEETEFYLAKIYSYAKHINHNFPIIIDGYREGEIDSETEKIIINKFNELNHQIIFTATLKNEESNHYNMYNINAINFSNLADSHILNSEYVSEFKQLLTSLGVVV